MDSSHNLFHAVHQLSRQLSKHLNVVLEPFGLFSAQWSVLFVLKTKGTLTQSELCEYLSIEAPPMSRTVQRLAKLGYVHQITGGDKRTKKIMLTEKAISAFPHWEKAVLQMKENLLRDFPKESQSQLYELLTQFLKQVD